MAMLMVYPVECRINIYFLPDTKVKATARPLKDAKVKKRPLQKQGSVLVNPQNAKPVLRSAEITRLWIGTESSGKWYWEVTIKNTGNVELEGQRVAVQGFKAGRPPAQNAWTAASGKVIGPPNLLPDQSRVIRMHWARCCSTDQLKIDLKDNVNNRVLDTKTETSMNYSPFVPVNVKIKRIEWNTTTQSWRAIIKNFTWYTVKILVEGNFYVGNPGGVPTPAGVEAITLRPNAEVTSTWKNTAGVQFGSPHTTLQVYWMMRGNPCNESKALCGGSRNITLPNSESFF